MKPPFAFPSEVEIRIAAVGEGCPLLLACLSAHLVGSLAGRIPAVISFEN